MYTNIDYFKSLNTLRFITAYFVLIHHSESMKAKNGILRISSLSFFENGSLAVTFFSKWFSNHIFFIKRENTHKRCQG